jgi:hypothetical protein
LIGQIKGTPTIKLFLPSKKNKPGKFNKKNVLDYGGAFTHPITPNKLSCTQKRTTRKQIDSQALANTDL